MSKKIQEPQYQQHLSFRDQKGLAQLGLRANATWDTDPRRLAIVLAQYKFASKMLSGKNKVLEIGCGDAFETRIVQPEVGSICAVDFDDVFLEDVKDRTTKERSGKWEMELRHHDMLAGPATGGFDAAYSLDVLEHINRSAEALYKRIS